MAGKSGFIARHGLWSDEQARLADELGERIEREPLHLVRLVWSDTHGHACAKAVSVAAFKEALRGGYNINVATWTLDAAGGRVFRSFTRGGGMALDEMTGSPNLVIVPDPGTFRVLPWAPGIGWVLCDEYFRDAAPFHFSARRRLRNALARLDEQGMKAVVGLEVEWYLARLLEERLTDAQVGEPGLRGRPPATTPPEPGFSYHSESNMDVMQPVLSELALAYEALGLGLRSVENEWGPGQVECTFSAKDAMRAADDFVLFRTATRQICRRLGWLASFMSCPALKGHYPSGWHLHLSLADRKSGKNLFMPADETEMLSPTGRHFLAGALEHAGACAVFATPTINGYRRFRANSLAPDRACWGYDHRGVMLRVLGGAGDAATRLENRIGEPAANPYLYIASQVAAGLDGIGRGLAPWPADDEPYEADRPMLPKSLGAALDSLAACPMIREAFGGVYIDYFIRLKQAEIARFEAFAQGEAEAAEPDRVTQWEMNEYFDFF